MDKRKLSILKAVINNYIETGSALSSGKLSQEYDFRVSPATIRYELAQLENEGFLTHQHTSAGRIPTDKGYRFYVDNFITSQGLALSVQDPVKILKVYKEIFNDISLILQQTVEILTDLTNCFCLISLPDGTRNVIKMIKVVLLNVHQVLVILLMSTGISKDFIINYNDQLDADSIEKVAHLLRRTLLDKSFSQLDACNVENMIKEIPGHRELIEKTFNTIKSAARLLAEKPNVFKKGTSKLMQYDHDFSSIEELRGIVEILEQENALARVLIDDSRENEGVHFIIGSENIDGRLKNCTLGQIKYNINDNQGKVLVVGPRRLRYVDVSNVLNSVAQTLDTLINE